jgi:hypothetical protein
VSSSRRNRDGTPVTDEVASLRVRHRRHAPHEPVPIRTTLQAEHPRTLAPCPPSRPGAPHAPSPWRLPGRDLNRDVIGREPPQSRGGSEQAPGGAGRAGRSALTRDVVFGSKCRVMVACGRCLEWGSRVFSPGSVTPAVGRIDALRRGCGQGPAETRGSDVPPGSRRPAAFACAPWRAKKGSD